MQNLKENNRLIYLGLLNISPALPGHIDDKSDVFEGMNSKYCMKANVGLWSNFCPNHDDDIGDDDDDDDDGMCVCVSMCVNFLLL